MGIDIYMNWKSKTKEDKNRQITGFANAGEFGYLRGAYFGGHSDIMSHLFDWMDWEKEPPFDSAQFEQRLTLLEYSEGARPKRGRWDYTKDSRWDISERQNTDVDVGTLQEYRKFLEFGKELIEQGQEPTIYISY